MGGRQLARLGDLVEARRVLPRPREDPLMLEPQDGRVGVPVVRQRANAGVRCHSAAYFPCEVCELRLDQLLPGERDGLGRTRHRDDHCASIGARRGLESIAAEPT